MLVCTMLLGNVNSVIASDNTKTMTITIGEGGVDEGSLSKTVTIPDLKNAKVKSVSNGGAATLTINGNNVNVSAKGGTPNRVVNNPKKYSRIASNVLTSGNNLFAVTNPYSDVEGYTSGGLAKDGVSKTVGGTYTPAHSKEVTGELIAEYNKDGYIGLLKVVSTNTEPGIKQDHSIGYSSMQIDTDDSVGIVTEGNTVYWGVSKPSQSNYVKKGFGVEKTPGYSYSASYDFLEWIGDRTRKIAPYIVIKHPDKITNIFGGTVTKPAVDTRVWQQDYKGTAYKAGTDNYYSYDVVIEYIDNSNPVLEMSTSSENSYFSKINMV